MNSKYIMREYDAALQSILSNGFSIDNDRTGVGTQCQFGISTKFDISERIPLVSKRKLFWKSVVKEVLWYIKGSHSINDLENMGVKFWSPWKSDEFTEKHNLPQGSGGYIYGFNLIHFGADIHDPEPKGFNQLDYVINALKKSPANRQACFTFWRPDTNNQAVLPACHAFYSFIVSPDKNGDLTILNCHMFQRSNDYPIGVTYDYIIATIFTKLIALELGMTTGTLYHTGSHCHIYKNALEATAEYCSRTDEPNSPILKINKRDSIYDYTIDDFELEDYNPLEKIDFPIAV